MKVFTSLLTVSMLISASLSITCTKGPLIQTMNQARAKPSLVGDIVKSDYMKTGAQGIGGDPTCYSECVSAANSQAALSQLTEEQGADAASRKITDLMVKYNTISHSPDGSTPDARIKSVMTDDGLGYPKSQYTEIIAGWPVERPSCMSILGQYCTDCMAKTRPHRVAMFNKIWTNIGASYGKGAQYRTTSYIMTYKWHKGVYGSKKAATPAATTARPTTTTARPTTTATPATGGSYRGPDGKMYANHAAYIKAFYAKRK